MFWKDSRRKDGHVNVCKECHGTNLNRVKKTYSSSQYNKYYKEDKKHCPTCNKYKPTSSFEARKGTYDKLSKECIKCKQKKQEERANRSCEYHRHTYTQRTDAELSYLSIYGSAGRRKKEFNITRSGFIQWYNTTNDQCHYCGIDGSTYSGIMTKLDETSTDSDLKGLASQVKYSPRLTIDRKDNNKGYSLDNICKSCWFCNVTKGVLLTEYDMSLVSSGIYRKLIETSLA